MSDKAFLQLIDTVQAEALSAIETAEDQSVLESVRVGFLGRKGRVTLLLKELKNFSEDEKRALGPRTQNLKELITTALDEKEHAFTAQSFDRLAEDEWVDVTEPGALPPRGHLHPLTQVQEEVEDAFVSLGFTVAETPELESEYFNFEALNVPAHHPARDMQDTFWLENGLLMRTHTSPFQVRSMREYGVPIRIVQAGRCFRYEATDASHDSTFYQVDGLMIDEGITVSHMMAVIKSVLSAVFRRDVEVRLRPGYFPFVEPGMELDFKCLLCSGKGCRVCKYTGWLEFMGCGMVHPNVLRHGNVDPNKYQGFAFGFGLSRLVMMRYAITDVRYLMSGDLRFLRQF